MGGSMMPNRNNTPTRSLLAGLLLTLLRWSWRGLGGSTRAACRGAEYPARHIHFRPPPAAHP